MSSDAFVASLQEKIDRIKQLAIRAGQAPATAPQTTSGVGPSLDAATRQLNSELQQQLQALADQATSAADARSSTIAAKQQAQAEAARKMRSQSEAILAQAKANAEKLQDKAAKQIEAARAQTMAAQKAVDESKGAIIQPQAASPSKPAPPKLTWSDFLDSSRTLPPASPAMPPPEVPPAADSSADKSKGIGWSTYFER